MYSTFQFHSLHQVECSQPVRSRIPSLPYFDLTLHFSIKVIEHLLSCQCHFLCNHHNCKYKKTFQIFTTTRLDLHKFLDVRKELHEIMKPLSVSRVCPLALPLATGIRYSCSPFCALTPTPICALPPFACLRPRPPSHPHPWPSTCTQI